MIISILIKPGSVAILCIINLFAQGALQRTLCWQCYFAFQTPLAFQLILSMRKFQNSFVGKQLTRSNSLPFFMVQLKSEKADSTIESTGLGYQKLSTKKLKTEVLFKRNINIQLLNQESSLVLINLYFQHSPFLFQDSD